MKSVNLCSTNISDGRRVWCLTCVSDKLRRMKLHLIHSFIFLNYYRYHVSVFFSHCYLYRHFILNVVSGVSVNRG